MKKRLLSLGLLLAFYIATLALYIVFLARDFSGAYYENTIAIKYSIVITSAAFTLLNFLYIKEEEHRLFSFILQTLAMVCTIIADYFLLVTGSMYETGVGFFIVTQLCYFLIILTRQKYGLRSLIIVLTYRTATPVVALIVMSIMGQLNLLYALTAIYFVQLVCNFLENIYLAVITKEKQVRFEHIILSFGFLLFICCDVCVGLSNLGYPVWKPIWLFYAPSQVILCSAFIFSKLCYHGEKRED